MTEKLSTGDMCRDCPNRSRVSKFMARLVGREQTVLGCEGSVNIHRGEIEYRERRFGEPEINQDEFKWSSVSGSVYDSGIERYFRTVWTDQVVCGREPVEPRGNEEPYSYDTQPWTNEDGSRHAAFVSGDDVSLQHHRGGMAIRAMLDSVDDYQAAVRDSDDSTANEALENIKRSGFTLDAVVGRGNIENKDDEKA